MLELSRTVRFCLNGDTTDLQAPRDNTFSAWPAMRGLGRYYEIVVTCRGEADPRTGYFINIKQIDQAVRDHALSILAERIERQPPTDVPMGELMRGLLDAVAPPLGDTVVRLSLVLTPFLQFALQDQDMDTILIQQQYEFAAAHRLHVPALSEQENRAVFGKCNNPAGHGHNYRVQVSARCPIDAQGKTIDPADLDAAVNARVIDALDHKHLNEDVSQFADLNPSVENIAKVIWSMLSEELPGEAELDEIKVWETGKTVCAYRG